MLEQTHPGFGVDPSVKIAAASSRSMKIVIKAPGAPQQARAALSYRPKSSSRQSSTMSQKSSPPLEKIVKRIERSDETMEKQR